MNFSQELKPGVVFLNYVKICVLVEELIELHILDANVTLIIYSPKKFKDRLQV